MNRPLRRVAFAVLLLFGALLANVTYVQGVAAGKLKADPHNGRVLLETYQRERGPIVVGGVPVARSVATSDALKYLRTYPGGARYAPLTGFYSLVYGATAVEKAEDGVLSGEDGRLFVRRLADLLTGKRAQGGAVQLTVNARAQDAAWAGLAGRRGAAVALDPRTGAILAMVSSPSYDPSVLSTHTPASIRAAWQRLVADPAQPLLNRAISARYPPGSVFKVVTSAAALSSGRYTEKTEIPAPDALAVPQTSMRIHNFAGESCGGGTVTLTDALRISCNTAFAGLGLAVGQDALRAQARAFGFGRPLSIPMGVAGSVFPNDLNPPQTAQSAIGQFDVAITPLQAAMIAAAVADHGRLMKPYLVASLLGNDLSVLSETSPSPLGEAVRPEVADQLTRMMEQVVSNGTGTAAQIAGVAVAGKTGTAQHGNGNAPPHAWFIGFAPANDPAVAVAVVVEDGGGAGSDATGGAVAAPIARNIIRAVLSR